MLFSYDLFDSQIQMYFKKENYQNVKEIESDFTILE